MGFYMVQAAYTSEAWAAMTKKSQDRSATVKELAQKLGGRVVNFYFCMGEYDVVTVMELHDETDAMAASLAALSAGHLKDIKTTRLFTIEESMEAMRKAGSLGFRGPSKE